jgi:DNA helicase HerA-like ATPase
MDSSRRQYFLVFEEGSSYFKEGFMRSKRFSNTAMLMSEGRNYGVRFMVITQFFASIDKTAMRYMKQRYFGYTDEKNDVTYIKAFLGEQASKLKDLHAGEFKYYNSGKTIKISIEPYECENTKTEILQPRILPEPKVTKPIRTNQSVGIELMKLAIIAIFVILTIGALR